MINREIITSLAKYGYLPNVPAGEVLGLRADDPVLLAAIETYRQFMQAPESLSVEKLFAIPRCGCPDFGPAAVGSGSWPSGCKPSWPNNHAVSYQVNRSGMPAFLVSIFEQAWSMMTAAYADIGMVILREDDNDQANSLVTWQRGAGWIGLAIVPQNPRCTDRIWTKFDTKYQPSQLLDQWARLLCHEIGHNMSLGHSSGGIMNPSIIAGPFTATAWRGDPSFNRLKGYFGGEPVNLNPIDPVPIWGIYPGGSDNS